MHIVKDIVKFVTASVSIAVVVCGLSLPAFPSVIGREIKSAGTLPLAAKVDQQEAASQNSQDAGQEQKPGSVVDSVSSRIVVANTTTSSVNKVLLVTAPPYNTICDGSRTHHSTNQVAIQKAFDEAAINGYSVQFPAGTCVTDTIIWSGQTFFGAGIGVTTVEGMPGEDVFASADKAGSFIQNAQIHDMTIEVDASLDASASASGGNNTFPNRVAGTTGGLTPISNPPVNNGPVVWGAIDSIGYGCQSTATAGSTTFSLSCGKFTAAPVWLVVGKQITINGAGRNLSISSWSIENNIATFTAPNSLTPGQVVVISGFGTSTFLNSPAGRTVLTATGSQFTVAFTHARSSSTESGSAALPFTSTIVSITDQTHVVMAAAPPVTITNGSGSYGSGNNPPWYIGNCGLAIPGTSATAQPLYMNGMTLTNLYFTTVGAQTGGYSHTCGVLMQAGAQGLNLTNIQFRSIYAGYIEAMPFSNYAKSEFTPDEFRAKNISSQGTFLSFVFVNGLHRVINGITVHTLDLPFSLGIMATQVPSYLSPTIGGTIDETYFDCWGNNSGEVQRFAGSGWNITGALANCGGGYTELSASLSKIEGGILNNLTVDGNHNVIEKASMNIGRAITNNGIDNTIVSPQVSTDSAQVRAYNIGNVAVQQPVGILDGGFITGGTATTPYISAADLVTTCADYRFAFVGKAITCVNDPTGTEFTHSYIHSTGTAGFGDYTSNYSWYTQLKIGTRFPLTKLYPTIIGRCEGAASCSANISFKSVDASNGTKTLFSCPVSFTDSWSTSGSYASANPCPVDLTSATYGDNLTWTSSTWSGAPVAVDIAAVAYQPFPQDFYKMARSIVGGQPVPGFLMYTGDGSDGAINATAGVTNVSNERYLTSLNVSAGATLSMQNGVSQGPLILRVSGACNIAGTISASVNDPGTTFVGNGGIAFGGGTGGGGGFGGSNGASAAPNSLSAPGRAGTAGVAGGFGSTPTLYQQRYFYEGFPPQSQSASPVAGVGGTAGGPGGGSGGAGGKGGGAVYLICGSLSFTGTIDASGGNGAAGTANQGGGGGGGGGFVVIRSQNIVTNTGAVNTKGGTGGAAGSGSATAGGAGAAGWSKVFNH